MLNLLCAAGWSDRLRSPLGIERQPWWTHGLELLGLVVFGFIVFFLMCAILDTQATKHMALHWIRRSRDCGRCLDEQTARSADQAFLKSPGGLTPIARSLHSGKQEAIDG